MFIRVLSDIHLELSTNGRKLMNRLLPTKPQLDHVLILAGDIGNPNTNIYKQFITNISKFYAQVFIVTGNHEYYQSKYKRFDHELKRVINLLGFPMATVDNIISDFTATLTNVHFLQRNSMIYNRTRFLGCTLWTKPDQSLTSSINDYGMIPDMSVHKCNELYATNVVWLKEQLEHKSDEYDNTVVITHHLPSFSLISKQYVNDPLNVFYASNLDHLVNMANIWVCGHSHTATTLSIGNCRCYINPVGYTNQYTGFNKDISISITEHTNQSVIDLF